MPTAPTQQLKRRRAAPSVAMHDASAWAPPATEGSSSERLAWPTAIAVIAGLSAGLWLGIGLVVSLTFG